MDYIEYLSADGKSGYRVPRELADQFGQVFERNGYYRKIALAEGATLLGHPVVFSTEPSKGPFVILEPRSDAPVIVEGE